MSRQGGHTHRLIHPSVNVQIAPESVPSTPSWCGDVVMLAHLLHRFGVLNAIEEPVRVARAHCGRDEVIDGVAVLPGSAVRGEPTLDAFSARLSPCSEECLALFGRCALPHPSTRSRCLSAVDHPCVEALRLLFQEDLGARTPKTSLPDGVWDQLGNHWMIGDVDGTPQTARQRSLLQSEECPVTHRRLDEVCAPGSFGRTRGDGGRTRPTILQAHTHHWLGTSSGSGNGDDRGELQRALQAIISDATAFSIPLSQGLIHVDGLSGNGVVITDVLTPLVGIVVRSNDDALLDLPGVQARLHAPPDQQVTHPETGTRRTLFDGPGFQRTAGGPCVRLMVAPHPATSTKKPSMGVRRGTPVFARFLTTAPHGACTAADVLGLSLHRGSCETVLAEEDQEQHTDRWVSHAPWGQEWWQIFHQWVWTLRVELGHHLSPTAMRLTTCAEASVIEPAPFGPPPWATAGQMGGCAGSACVPPSDGTVCCPTGHSLFPHERRPERDGSLRIVSAARSGRCRPCPVRDPCLGSATTTTRPRRVRAVLWPLSASPPKTSSLAQESTLPSSDTSALAPLHPLLWGEWERCQIRRRWRRLFRTYTVSMTTPRCTSVSDTVPSPGTTVLTRAHRSHARLAWDHRLARTARLSTAPSLQITIHGLPASCAQSFGCSLIAASPFRLTLEEPCVIVLFSDLLCLTALLH